MINFKKIVSLVLLSGSLLSTVVLADPGTTVLPFLDAPVGARAIALAGATDALNDGVLSLFGNPAALANLTQGDGSFSHQVGIADISSEIIGVAYPIPNVATLGLGMLYRGQPDIDNNIPGEAAIAANDIVISVAGASSLTKEFNLGGTVKLINSTLGEYHAFAAAIDIGAQFQAHPLFNAGIRVSNLGTQVTYIDQGSPLPLKIALAVGTQVELAREHAFSTGLDINYAVHDALASAQIGTEYVYDKMISIRAGYALEQDSMNSIGVGFGFRYAASGLTYKLDYAFAPKLWDSFAQSDAEHTVTLGIAF